MGLLNNGITILHFDETYNSQQKLLSYQHEDIDLRKLRGVHLYCENNSLKQIHSALSRRRKKGITFLGSGNHHYATYLLLQELKKPFTLVLFDNHTDISPDYTTEEMITCGSWVSFALANIPMLKQVVIIGPSPDQKTLRYSNVTVLPFKKMQPYSSKRILAEIKMDAVYVSIDKDILNKTAAITNWDQGSMNISTLTPYLKNILTNKSVYGIDICGELPPSPVLAFQQGYQRSIQKNESTNIKVLQTCITYSRSKSARNKNLA